MHVLPDLNVNFDVFFQLQNLHTDVTKFVYTYIVVSRLNWNSRNVNEMYVTQ